MMVNSKKHAAFIFANKICVSTCQLEGTDMEMKRHNYTPENKLEPKIWWFVDVFHFPGGRSGSMLVSRGVYTKKNWHVDKANVIANGQWNRWNLSNFGSDISADTALICECFFGMAFHRETVVSLKTLGWNISRPLRSGRWSMPSSIPNLLAGTWSRG